jgi:hypothetical protein
MDLVHGDYNENEAGNVTTLTNVWNKVLKQAIKDLKLRLDFGFNLILYKLV